MEASALQHAGVAGLHGRSPLLRLQSDERLVALIRRGNHHAFEALVARYQSRLLAFCRHMLSSREDAEDVLQEVFAAAFNAMLADEREINVRPWLYRIARNRSLNHLRRAQAVGMDSMDVHLSEGGLTTADKVHKREEFRLLIADVQDLPETQRTALLLREIDALSYDQIAEAMETTVPSVKSLLVRARVSLAEAAEARLLSCDEVRLELGEVAEGLTRTTAPVRRHLRTCERCTPFRKQLRHTNRALAALLPVGPLLLLKKTLLAHLGTTAAAGGGTAAASGGALGRRRRRAPGRLRHDRQQDRGGPGRGGDRHRRRRRGPARVASRAPRAKTAIAKVAPPPPHAPGRRPRCRRRRRSPSPPARSRTPSRRTPKKARGQGRGQAGQGRRDGDAVRVATADRHRDPRPRATAATRRRCRPTRSAPPSRATAPTRPRRRRRPVRPGARRGPDAAAGAGRAEPVGDAGADPDARRAAGPEPDADAGRDAVADADAGGDPDAGQPARRLVASPRGRCFGEFDVRSGRALAANSLVNPGAERHVRVGRQQDHAALLV